MERIVLFVFHVHKKIQVNFYYRVFSFECECIFDKNANATRLEVDVVTQQYNQKLFKIAADYKALVCCLLVCVLIFHFILELYGFCGGYSADVV